MTHISLKEIDDLKHRIVRIRSDLNNISMNISPISAQLQSLEERILSLAIATKVHEKSLV